MGEGEGSRARGGVASTSCDAFIAEHLLVYATARWHYVVAGSGDKSRWRILKISHEESPAGRGLVVAEDRTEYDEGQCARIIAAIADGNAATGGARQVARGVALLGSIRLVTGHHLILAKERVPLGTVCGHAVYGVGATELVRVASASPRRNARDAHRPPRRAAADANAEERRLKRLLSRVDLTGGFFFSHTYRLTATLQANAFDPNAALRRDFDSMFAWNAHLSHPLRAALGEDAASRWLVPLVHGFFSQRVVDLVGRRVRIALVARRSRHFAGTRYRRRGVNEEGHVANEVETEQIVDDPGGRGFGSRRVPAFFPASCSVRFGRFRCFGPRSSPRASRAPKSRCNASIPRTPPPRATFNAWTIVSVLRRSCLVWFEVRSDAPGRARCEANSQPRYIASTVAFPKPESASRASTGTSRNT